MAEKRPRLGKGLGALLGEYLPEEGKQADPTFRRVPVTSITPNPYQPRTEFDTDELTELADSIRENGLLQPLVVRAHDMAEAGTTWQLIAGERRWRAVRQLGWTEVPVVVREADDQAVFFAAMAENVERARLTPIEEAHGYRRAIEEFGLTQREVAEKMGGGKKRSTVANMLRLLQLPASVQRLLMEGRISEGHARALLGLDDERRIADLARAAADKELTVRAVERMVRNQKDQSPDGSRRAEPEERAQGGPGQDGHVRMLEGELQRRLGTAVRINLRDARAGRIEIPFYGEDDFQRVIDVILGPEAERP